MKDQFIKILNSLTEGFDKNTNDTMIFNSGLSIERASENDVASLKEAINEFNSNSNVVKVTIEDFKVGVPSLPSYMLKVYNEIPGDII